MSRLPLILGHRGASALAPENTIAAFRRSIDDGADGIEFDVRLTREGVAVVIHDDTLKRTAAVHRRVSQMTAAELATTDVGRWFRAADGSRGFSGETVPSLQQVFDLYCANDGFLYLEMKPDAGTEAELVSEVVRMIKQSKLRDRIIVECFDLPLIQKVKEIDSDVKTAALFEPKLSRPISFVRPRLAAIAHAHGADEIALHHTLVSPRSVENSLRLGLRVVVWTVDNSDWVQRAQSLGVIGLITNNPAQLRARRDSS